MNTKITAQFETPEQAVEAAQRVRHHFTTEHIAVHCSSQKFDAYRTGVTPRRVNYYCAGGRIPGAVKMAGVWLIPKTAEKPIDGRTKQGKELRHE